MNRPATERTNSGEYAPKKEYQKIYNHELSNNDWSELEAYVDYLAEYCKYVGIEDKPEKDEYSIDLKSFFGTYKFESGRTLKIKLDSKKTSEAEQDQLLDEIIEWLAILGPNLLASLEMLDPCGIDEFELSFSILLNELTSNLLKEYLPPALQLKRYTSPKILGRIKVPETVTNLTQGKLLFTSERAQVNLESLPVLFLIRIHYEMLSALDKSIERIVKMIKADESGYMDKRKLNFALLREMKKSRAYHIELLSNPLYAQLLEKALETDFDDPFTLDKVRKEASTRRSLQDILYLWDAYRGKKVPKPRIKDILSGGYTFKPASKLYELWTLKVFLNVLSDILQQKWSAQYENGEAVFSLRDQSKALTLVYNSAKTTHHKFKPKRFKLRPDFVLTLKTLRSEARTERVLLIADAKYKPKPDKSDLERMLAYMLTYCWDELEETANGLFLYIGTNDTPYDSFRDPYERVSPNARIYSLCLRPNNVAFAKGCLEEIILDVLRNE